jgi:hypothetical protein
MLNRLCWGATQLTPPFLKIIAKSGSLPTRSFDFAHLNCVLWFSDYSTSALAAAAIPAPGVKFS